MFDRITQQPKLKAVAHFKPHIHFECEEIHAISGEYSHLLGSWIRSPHLSQHNPYVEKDTLIYVNVGHL